jgi:restriction system protein
MDTSSGQSRYYNQVAWARQYLAWEGLLDTSQHGIWALSPKGENTTLTDKQAREIFLKWVDIHRKAKKDKTDKEIIEEQEESEPDNLQAANKTDLLQVLQSLTPDGFERICQRLSMEKNSLKCLNEWNWASPPALYMN